MAPDYEYFYSMALLSQRTIAYPLGIYPGTIIVFNNLKILTGRSLGASVSEAGSGK